MEWLVLWLWTWTWLWQHTIRCPNLPRGCVVIRESRCPSLAAYTLPAGKYKSLPRARRARKFGDRDAASAAMRHAVVLMRGPGDKAQHDGQCASYSVIGRRGWTIVTLPDGTDVSWRTRHWAPAPAAAQRGRLMALGAGLLNVPGLLLGGLRSCTRRLGMARPGVGARRRAWEASCACARSLLLMAVAVLACMGYLLTTIFTVLCYLAAGGWQLVRLAPAIGRAILLAMATLDFEWCTLLVNRKAQQAPRTHSSPSARALVATTYSFGDILAACAGARSSRMPACSHPEQAPFREQHDAPHAPSGCDSRTGRDRELGIDIFAPASLALVQRCDIPHGSKVPRCATVADALFWRGGTARNASNPAQ